MKKQTDQSYYIIYLLSLKFLLDNYDEENVTQVLQILDL